MSNSFNFLPGVSVCLSRDFNNKWLPLSPHYKEKSKSYKLLLVDAYIFLKPKELEKPLLLFDSKPTSKLASKPTSKSPNYQTIYTWAIFSLVSIREQWKHHGMFSSIHLFMFFVEFQNFLRTTNKCLTTIKLSPPFLFPCPYEPITCSHSPRLS